MTDRRARRHQATKEEILAAAWSLARECGLTGWTLRELAAAVGMRAPSLYVYFENKDAIYDGMFAQGYQRLLDSVDPVPDTDDPAGILRHVAHLFFDFYVADPARALLLFHRTIPGFAPSPPSYALAQRALERMRGLLLDLGFDDPRAVDLFNAVITGLASQQVSNDPGGDRWERLIDAAVDAFLASRVAH